MAKKKTATTKAIPTLKNTVRNAVNKIWRVVNRLDDDNIIGITYNADTKEFSAVNEVTGEELNGGGGGLNNPILTMNIVFEETRKVEQKSDFAKSLNYLSIENNTLVNHYGEIIDQSRTITAIVPYGQDLDNNPGYFQLTTEMGEFTPSNLDNCTASGYQGYYNYIQITDPTQDASITITCSA